MPKREGRKIFASDALDDLLNIKNQHSGDNWLLSYLDVFVLVVMLMVTLVSISDFNHQADLTAEHAKATAQQKRLKAQLKAAQVRPDKQNLDQSKPLPTPAVVVIAPKQEVLPTAIPSPEPAPLEPVKPTAEPSTPDEQLQIEFNDKIKLLGLQDAIKMRVGKGLAHFDIQDKVLFESSTADLTSSGKSLLTRLTPLLKESAGLIIVEGHTDNRPIKHGRFSSNWELSAARAMSVLHFLTAQQLEPQRLRATSYGDTKPIADNSTKAGREKNRRVNIIVQVENFEKQITIE